MSDWGSTDFVIEGSEGRKLYDKIIKSVEECTDFNQDYAFDEVDDHKYTIARKQNDDGAVEYFIHASLGEKTSVFSWFSLDKIRFEDNHLSLTEYFTHGYGALEFYISDLNLQKALGFYYYKTSESDFCGCTNDAEAKYFKRFCEYVIIAPDFKDKMPADFDDMSFEDQVAFCDAHPEELVSYWTRLEDFDSI